MRASVDSSVVLGYLNDSVSTFFYKRHFAQLLNLEIINHNKNWSEIE